MRNHWLRKLPVLLLIALGCLWASYGVGVHGETADGASRPVSGPARPHEHDEQAETGATARVCKRMTVLHGLLGAYVSFVATMKMIALGLRRRRFGACCWMLLCGMGVTLLGFAYGSLALLLTGLVVVEVGHVFCTPGELNEVCEDLWAATKRSARDGYVKRVRSLIR